MGPLGIVMVWGAYLFGIWGYSKMKSAYNPAGSLSLSDLALPSHRGAYIQAVAAWGTSTSSTGQGVGAAPGGGSAAPGPSNSAGQPSTQLITPTTPGGNTGVDLNGNKYTRSCSTCPWQLVQGPTGLPIASV